MILHLASIYFVFFGAGVFALGQSQISRCEKSSNGSTNLMEKFPELSLLQENSLKVGCSAKTECFSTCKWSTTCHKVALRKKWPTPFYKPLKSRVSTPTGLRRRTRPTSRSRTAINRRRQSARRGRTNNRKTNGSTETERRRSLARRRLQVFRRRNQNKRRTADAVQDRKKRKATTTRDTLYSVLGIRKVQSSEKSAGKRFKFYCCLVTSRIVKDCGWLPTPLSILHRARRTGRQRHIRVDQLKVRVFGRTARNQDAAIRDFVLKKSTSQRWVYQVEICLTEKRPIPCRTNQERRNPSDNNAQNSRNGPDTPNQNGQQQMRSSNTSIKFSVAPNVQRGKVEELKEKSLTDCAEDINQYWTKVNKGEGPLEFETGQLNFVHLVQGWYNKHEFINAVLMAYNEHLPLILSPDDFWLLISLAISTFIGSDEQIAEKYRETFVDHQGKKTLAVRGEPFGIVPKSPKANKEGWPRFVEAICSMIAQETRTNISQLLSTPFSTTGPVEQTVFGISLMESMKNYFQYKLVLQCGIPEIVLEGTPSDYSSILDRLKALKSILPDFQWYLDRVEKRMKKVHESSLGQVDRDFWRTMVLSEPEGSGSGRRFTGWLSEFIGFLYDSNKMAVPNNKQDSKDLDLFQCSRPAVTLTDFVLEDGLYTMKIYDMKLVGGFLGTAQVESDLVGPAVRPAIGWMTYYWKEASL